MMKPEEIEQAIKDPLNYVPYLRSEKHLSKINELLKGKRHQPSRKTIIKYRNGLVAEKKLIKITREKFAEFSYQ